VLTWLAARGIGLDAEAGTAAEELPYAIGVSAYAFGVHWLETRKGDGMFARAARGLARLLLFGAPARVVYRPVGA
jgi:hypothetical protein